MPRLERRSSYDFHVHVICALAFQGSPWPFLSSLPLLLCLESIHNARNHTVSGIISANLPVRCNQPTVQRYRASQDDLVMNFVPGQVPTNRQNILDDLTINWSNFHIRRLPNNLIHFEPEFPREFLNATPLVKYLNEDNGRNAKSYIPRSRRKRFADHTTRVWRQPTSSLEDIVEILDDCCSVTNVECGHSNAVSFLWRPERGHLLG